jgi:hypothetical protein
MLKLGNKIPIHNAKRSIFLTFSQKVNSVGVKAENTSLVPCKCNQWLFRISFQCIFSPSWHNSPFQGSTLFFLNLSQYVSNVNTKSPSLEFFWFTFQDLSGDSGKELDLTISLYSRPPLLRRKIICMPWELKEQSCECENCNFNLPRIPTIETKFKGL